ncbi:C4-dicarboxylate transporter DcuC [Budviciaceae bacterium BWR-B9]|uniref:C4-dicarboxylate transporter DcuC n=1 Tax=Limnobaculum allomyrinae TaxID=2791986 RepID=A0ABS1IPF4_9GAMM|nr:MULTISPECIES: C4-dicarboxylate transporter DcuC [Limnobaculum]MBK5143416.1 C4-dicarboxylate transporter DcuC [Limnobaculum allomyrinae]MBV7691304.1 C4-dicarboxylate transporter DcuC [Limnobaculum sp. M2-1]
MIQIIIALLVIVVVARLILKGYKAEPVLLAAGLLLMFCTLVTGWGELLPKSVKSTGISWFDPFEVTKWLFSTRAADLGLMIMALMGFAHYMDHIGANDAVVRVATRPLRKLRSPYILLFFSYLLASVLQLAIPSATGLAVLLMGTMFPIMLGLGLSSASAAGVIATSLGIAYTPTAIDAIRGSQAAGMEVVQYVLNYQGPAAVATVLVVGTTHVFWQRYCDSKQGLVANLPNVEEQAGKSAPGFYALLPMLPIIMAVGFSPIFVSGVKLHVVTIVLIAMFICMIIELLRLRDFKQVSAGFNKFLGGMGSAFANVVGLLVAAGAFAHGIMSIGAIDQMILMAEAVGLPPFAMAIVFAIVTLAAAIIMGSGNAPFLAFVELIPKIAESMGASATAMILPMQQASHMGRAMSPVSGVVIAVASGAKLQPFEVVKRTSVPLLVGLVVHTLIIGLFY